MEQQMNSKVRRILRRIAKYLGIGAIFIAVNAYSYVSGLWVAKDQVFRDWPNLPGCQLTIAASYPSIDGDYLASILKRSCANGEFIDYFFYLDYGDRRPGTGLSWRRIELENDQYPVGDPGVVWTKDRSLQVTVSTKTLSGTLVEKNQGSNIEIVLVYEPREPGAFTNEHH